MCCLAVHLRRVCVLDQLPKESSAESLSNSVSFTCSFPWRCSADNTVSNSMEHLKPWKFCCLLLITFSASGPILHHRLRLCQSRPGSHISVSMSQSLRIKTVASQKKVSPAPPPVSESRNHPESSLQYRCGGLTQQTVPPFNKGLKFETRLRFMSVVSKSECM